MILGKHGLRMRLLDVHVTSVLASPVGDFPLMDNLTLHL